MAQAIVQFNSIEELQKLQKWAGKIDEDAFIHSLDDTIMVDAKSFIGLFSLDFSKPVKVISDNETFISKVADHFTSAD